MMLACCILIAISLYLILENALIKKLLGVVLLGSTINLVIFISGLSKGKLPVFWQQSVDLQQYGNPLTQALILTAIVIGFSLFVLLTAVIKFLLKRKD